MSKDRMTSEASNEFATKYNDRFRRIREAATAATKELSLFRSAGSVPQEALDGLMDRRREQQQYGSWVEGHYTEQGKGIRYTEIKFSRRPKGKGHRRR